MIIELGCPACLHEINVEAKRWTGRTECPFCGTTLKMDFDFTVMDDGEEWDHYRLVEVKSDKNDRFPYLNLDYFTSYKYVP